MSMIKPRWPFWKRIIPAAAASLMFELIQYIFAIGGTDITDFLSNTLGGVAGAGFYVLCSKLFKEKTTRILNIVALVGTIGIILLGLLMMRFVTYRF
jgi:glycopeptide antibiotics resistance protein